MERKFNDPIFIVGVPRSGTTWVWGLLTSHNDVLSLEKDDFDSNERSIVNNKRVTSETGAFIRYENDFTSYFNINYILSIDSLLNRLIFKDNDLKIYIACSDIKKLSKTVYLCNDVNSYKNIIFKDDYFKKYNIHNLNFEEKAFIDFLIGINSQEIYGHSKSSFSGMINMFKNTKNYYD